MTIGSPKNLTPAGEAATLSGEKNVVIYIVAAYHAVYLPAVFMLCSIAQLEKTQNAD